MQSLTLGEEIWEFFWLSTLFLLVGSKIWRKIPFNPILLPILEGKIFHSEFITEYAIRLCIE